VHVVANIADRCPYFTRINLAIPDTNSDDNLGAGFL